MSFEFIPALYISDSDRSSISEMCQTTEGYIVERRNR